MHLSRATDKAARLAKTEDDFMAVVHCGCGEYTVKRETLAQKHYPADIRRIVTPGGKVIEKHHPSF